MIEIVEARAAQMQAAGQPIGKNESVTRALASTRGWLFGHDEESLWLMEQARERAPASVVFLQHQAASLISLERADEALGLCVERLRVDPYDLELGTLTAAALRHIDDLAPRVAHWKREADEARTDPFPWVMLAHARWAAGEVEGAVDALDHLAKLKPKAAVPHHWQAMIYTQADRFQEAASAAHEVVARDPDSVPGLQLLTEALERLGSYEEARDVAERALEKSPDAWDLRSTRGRLEFLCEGEEAGLRYSNAHFLLPPVSPGSQPQFLTDLLRNERPKFAFALLERYLEEHPSEAVTNLWYGWATVNYPDHGDIPRAVSLAEEALEAVPDSAWGWAVLASLFERAGQPAKSLEAFDRVEQLSGKALHGQHRMLRAQALWRIGKKEEARKALAAAVAYTPARNRHRALAPTLGVNRFLNRLEKEARALIK